MDAQGQIDLASCVKYCSKNGLGASAIGCSVIVSDAGASTLDCSYSTCITQTGRRPEGLQPGDAARGCRAGGVAPSPVARILASAAYLEAASVHAFRHLARELRAHGAPARLRTAARRAARDEVRHARVMTDLAARAGATVDTVRVDAVPVRSLEAIARENAVEGCVHETYGAAVAHVQAARARDPRVRAALERIAVDEASHAELSWQVAQWIERRLAPAARDRVRSARAQAVEALASSLATMPEGPEIAELGLPNVAQASTLVRELRSTLWDDRPRARRPASRKRARVGSRSRNA